MKIKNSAGENIFVGTIYILIGLLCIVTTYPFWYMIVVSLSDGTAMTLGFRMWPEKVSTLSWVTILQSSLVWKSFLNTIVRTFLGTAIAMTVNVTMAYPLSRRDFFGRKLFTSLLLFTMIFGGGMIPAFILITKLDLIDTIWALVLPGAGSAFSIIILRNFFQSIPESINESARIDGATDFRILIQLIIPLSLPVLATTTLWGMVGHWNAWFDALLYLNSRSKYVLQLVLREILVDKRNDAYVTDIGGAIPPTSESLQGAITLFATAPILIVYPFLQRYFASGIMIGAVKG